MISPGGSLSIKQVSLQASRRRIISNAWSIFEACENVSDAIAREKQLKGWRRAKKIKLIEGLNPKWADLSRETS
jgi:putative endonuclease